MKKRILTLLFVAIMSVSLTACKSEEKPAETTPEETLVTTVSETETEKTTVAPESKARNEIIFDYDGTFKIEEFDGNKTTKTICFNYIGKCTSFYISEGDDGIKAFTPEGQLVRFCIIRLNDDNKHEKEMYFDYNGESSHYIDFEYNEEGLETKYHVFTPDGTTSYYYTSEYDDKGRKIKETHYESDDSVNYIDTWEYNENDLFINHSRDYGDYTASALPEYDNEGNIIKVTYLYNDTLQGLDYLEYNDNGKVTKYTYTTENEPENNYHYTCEYDANGNLVKLNLHNNTGYHYSSVLYYYDDDDKYLSYKIDLV